MRPLNIFQRIILRLFSRKENTKTSDELKEEMCMKAINAGVCPHTCEICAWNRFTK